MRHLARHVAKTVADRLLSELTTLGWVNDPRVFNASPVQVRNVDPHDVNTSQQEPNLVAVWIDDEGPTSAAELGGGLADVLLALDVHLWADNPSVASALASDIKDILRGLVLPVTDYAQTPAAPSATAQLEVDEDEVTIVRPVGSVTAADFKRNWRIVSTVTRVHLTE